MKQKNYDELELRDDFIFGKVMGEPEICRKTLEVVLGTQIERVEYPEKQKIIDLTIDGRSVRLDLYVQDDKDIVYNAEMQQADNSEIRKELPKRSRYYQGMIDLNLLEKGTSYKELQESYIIFICTFDPFGQNRAKYTFKSICLEEPDIILNDMTTKIFLNTKGDRQGISEELSAFLDYIETKQPVDAFTKQIDNAVERVKRNEEWRREYMKGLLMKYDAKIEGEALFAALTKRLLQDERTEDLMKATEDIEFRKTLYKEYELDDEVE